MDLPDSAAKIENIFAHTVLFVHNVALSVALLVRSPMRGPMRLLVRSRSKTLAQAGPYTMLFLSVSGILFFLQDRDQLGMLAKRLVLEQTTPATIIAEAFVIVMLLDVLLRGTGYVYVERRPRIQARFQVTALYAFCAQAAYILLILVVFRIWDFSSL